MDDSLVYRKTGSGAAQLTATHGSLSPPARRVLIMLDGSRTIGELADLFGIETVEREIAELEAKGFARRVDPDRPAPQTVSQPLAQRPTTIGGTPEVQPSELAVASRRGAPRIIALIGLVAAVAAGAYWYVGRAGSVTEASASPAGSGQATAAMPGVAASDAVEADRASAASAKPEGTGAGAPVSGPQIAAFTPAPVISISAMAVPARKPAAAGNGPAATEPPAPAPAPATASPAQAPAPAAPVRAAEPKSPREVTVPKGETAASAERTDAAPAPTATAVPVSAPAASPAVQAASAPGPVALAQPTLEPPAPVQLHPRKHEPPQFPVRAIRAGVLQGHVEARVWVNADGKVEQVDIVRASPPRYFDEEVRRALSLWTFDPPPRPVQELVELDFKP